MAFGEETSTPQRVASLGYTPANGIRQGYTGYEQDTESGLDFAQARYYNSAHGRFTSVDPLTASANVKNPQTFNRYSYVLNSPYKFTDPLGLISRSTGACGQWCANSGDYIDGSAFSGTDTVLKGIFDAMDLSQRVEQALEALESGAWVPGIGLTDAGGEKTAIGKALKNMLENGNATAQSIASDIIYSNITIDVTNGSDASTSVTSVSSLNSAIAGGKILYQEALGYLTIYIPQSEFSNSVSAEAAIESTLIHEGTHAQSIARVIESISVGGTLDKKRSTDEEDAKMNAANYEIYKGGKYLKHGQESLKRNNVTPGQGLIDSSGNINTTLIQNISGTVPFTIREKLKQEKVKW